MKKIKTNLFKNTLFSLIFEIVTIVCGFILPKIILNSYGSATNGLINSITQFLSIISFMELGIGAVIQSSLYKPLSDKNSNLYSEIYVSGQKFFNKIGITLVFYVIALIVLFPLIINKNFDWTYIVTLILSMSISYFAQYFFGISDRLLLNADQKGYIQYNAQTITLILNTLFSFILIKCNASIQFVKLVTSLIYLARPVVLRIYINKKYHINREITYTDEPIKQKWNGIAQHVSAIIIDSTDIVVLTLFSTLENISIYSVYYLVINGIRQLLISLTKGVQSYIGNLWAKKDYKNLNSFFEVFEFIWHNITIFLFGCTSILIVPFVQIYTKNINDANYVQPLFALLMSLAFAFYCLRSPYNLLILASGKYKETQQNYIFASIINIVISCIMVFCLGLIGIAIGTLAALSYQTFWMAYYSSKKLIDRSFLSFLKTFIVDVIIFLIGYLLTKFLPFKSISISSWLILAVEVSFIWILVIVIINVIFNLKKIKESISIRKMVKKS